MITQLFTAAVLSLLLTIGAEAQQNRQLRISIGADVGFTFAVVAADKGFFEKRGISAQYRIFDDGSVALDALLSGESDVSMSSALGGIARRARGGNLFVTSQICTSGVNVGLVAREAIKEPGDLEGQKVAYPVGTGGQEFFLKYTDYYKLDRSKVKQSQLAGPEALAALSRGDVDAIFIFEPWMERAVNNVKGTRVLAKSGEKSIYFQRCFIFFGQRLAGDPALGGDVLRAIDDAINWIKGNPDEAADLAAKRFHVSVEDAKRALARFDFQQRFFAEDLEYMASAGQLLVDNGVIKEIPSLNSFIQIDTLKAAFPDRVTVSK